ncbi:MAG TPA: sigma-70 family RNA polymerase sigma factor [Pyrinomonadaceae bacterium]|nr:sigma-70 family RNA polymerase sigma factor [Pyrinomonadaceae bacterium]
MSLSPITRDADENLELDKLYPLVYDELRRLAGYYMRQERTNHTLQPTALVHEAYLRMFEQEKSVYMSRTQFIGMAANMMRRILVNHAVSRNRQKREGSLVRVTLDRVVDAFDEDKLNLLILDEALHDLANLDPRQARVFELRFFGGLTIEEVGEVLDISPATVKREWTIAKLYLQRELYNRAV